jgi:hypothetical protein
MFAGRVLPAYEHARMALQLQTQADRDPFDSGWSRLFEAGGQLYAGQVERSLELYAEMANDHGLTRLIGLFGLLHGLPAAGRAAEARAIADEAIAAAHAHRSPFWVAGIFMGCGRAFAASDPTRARSDLRTGLAYAREHGLPFWETRIAREAAALEGVYGDVGEALELFEVTVTSLRHAGEDATLAVTVANLAVLLLRIGRHEAAAVLHGAASRYTSVAIVIDLPSAVEKLREALGPAAFDAAVATGAAMDVGETVAYAREQVRLARG